MSFEAPPRLKHDAELGPILRAADTPVAGERIAANGEAVKAAIAAGLARASLPLWKLVLPFVLALVAGGIAVQRTRTRDVAAPVGRDVIARDPQPAIAIAERDVVYEPPPPAEGSAPPPPAVVVRPHAVATSVEPPADVPAPSVLPEQIALYEDARAAAGRGDLARGIDLLDELLRRFPGTPLRAEAELTRAELLTRADRLADAAAALEALATDATHRGRRGELLRALGDVRRKQGDCAAAVDAYTRARTAGVTGAESQKVDRGLERCAKK
jgi:tetratricopeptide (TPR) repeat protein